MLPFCLIERDKMNGWYFDIESDGFYLQSKTIWYIKLKTLDNTRSMSVYPFRENCRTKEKLRPKN